MTPEQVTSTGRPAARRRIGLVALVAALIPAAWVVGTLHETEPRYEGKPLSTWLKSYAGGCVLSTTTFLDFNLTTKQKVEEANEAVRAIGTNAMPTLLRMLREKDSALKIKFQDTIGRRIFVLNVTGQPRVINLRCATAEQRNLMALYAFWQLGTNAHSAVPELTEIAKKKVTPESQLCAIHALGGIGPAARAAVPLLTQWATNADDTLCGCAIFNLRWIDPEAVDGAVLAWKAKRGR
jgi:hypothetical protein